MIIIIRYHLLLDIILLLKIFFSIFGKKYVLDELELSCFASTTLNWVMWMKDLTDILFFRSAATQFGMETKTILELRKEYEELSADGQHWVGAFFNQFSNIWIYARLETSLSHHCTIEHLSHHCNIENFQTPQKKNNFSNAATQMWPSVAHSAFYVVVVESWFHLPFFCQFLSSKVLIYKESFSWINYRRLLSKYLSIGTFYCILGAMWTLLLRNLFDLHVSYCFFAKIRFVWFIYRSSMKNLSSIY